VRRVGRQQTPGLISGVRPRPPITSHTHTTISKPLNPVHKVFRVGRLNFWEVSSEPVVFAGGLVSVAGALLTLILMAKSIVGYRATGSPTLLRLSASFLFLLLSMMVRAAYASTPASLNTLLQFAYAATETLAFFFLALAHYINMRSTAVAASFILPLVGGVSPEALVAAFRAITIYLASFSVLGSLLSIRRREVVFTSMGFTCLVAGSFIEWLPIEPLNLAFIGIPLRLAGIVLLSLPLLPLGRHEASEMRA
jgi:hypothetical protein